MGTETTPTRVRELLVFSQEGLSLQAPVGDEEAMELGDFLPDERATGPAEAAAAEGVKRQVGAALGSLTERERRVLELRYGIGGGEGRTLEAVADEFGVSRERIRQIEAKALRKLRHPSRSRKLRDLLD